MSGLREAFDQIVMDIPVYGDLDRAIEQADRERRRRYGTAVGLTAAAAVLVVVAGMVAVSHGTDSAPPTSPRPTPVSPSPTTTKSQSPQTWSDTPVAATHRGWPDWKISDPLRRTREAWFAVAAEHLDPKGEHFDALDDRTSSPWAGDLFTWRDQSTIYQTFGQMGVVADRSDLDPFDGCRYLMRGPNASNGTESCSADRFVGPHGERARISRYQRLCGSWDPGREGDDARPGPGSTYATCGDFRVAVAVERRDGLIGYVEVNGRGTTDFNPFTRDAMAAAAADPRVTVPEAAFAVPSDRVVAAVLAEHVPGSRPHSEPYFQPDSPGYAGASAKVGRLSLGVQVSLAGSGQPSCGSSWLVECVERRVFGADDPTTVYVGTWDEDDWAGCCPRNSRATRRVFVYVGPRHTVVVSEFRIVRAHEDRVGAELDQQLIDVALDSRLQ